VFHNPIEKSSLKSDIVTDLFALNPFVAQYLLAFGQELLIKHRILDQIRGIFLRGFHEVLHDFLITVGGVNDIRYWPKKRVTTELLINSKQF
jgi:hypothetical protein